MDGVEILDEEEAGEPTEEEIIEYARFLDIDPDTEPHLMWIAKEGVAAPVPEPWKACTEDDEVFYFNFETSESIWDHPCDSHYKKLLEEEREKYAKRQANGDLQPGTGNIGISGDSLPAGSKSGENGSREIPQADNSPDSDIEHSKSFVSEAVDSDSEVASSQSRSPKGATHVVASDSRGSLADDSRASVESKSFVSEAVSDSEISTPNRSPTAASNTKMESKNVQQSSSSEVAPQMSPKDQAEMWKSMSGGDAMSTPRSSRSSRSASSLNSRNPPIRQTSSSPKSAHSSRSRSSDSRAADCPLENAPDSPRSSRNSFDDERPPETLESPKSSRSADSREKDIIAPTLDPSPKSSKSADSGENNISAPTLDPPSKSMENKDTKAEAEIGQDGASNAKPDEMPKRIPANDSLQQGSPKSSTQGTPQGSDRPLPVLDHGGYSARSSNPSEISEDFHSDWGVLSPPFSARSGKALGADVQNSLEFSATVVDARSIDNEVNKSLGILSQQDKQHLERKVDRLLGRPKTWHSLQEDVQVLKDALETIAFIRSKQKEYLKIVKIEVPEIEM